MAEQRYDSDAIRDEIATLRRQLGDITDHMRHSTLGKSMSDGLSGLTGEASKIYEDLSAQGRDQIGRVTHAVEERPLLWVLAAFAVGFLGSRLLDRR